MQDSAFKFALMDEITSFKPLAKKILAILKNKKYPGKGSLGSKLGFKTLRDEGILPILFPLFAYHLPNPKYQKLAADFLNAKSLEFNDVRRAYLKFWGKVADVNFVNVLRKYEISLED